MPSAVSISIFASLAIIGTVGYVAYSKVINGGNKRRGYTGAYDPKTGLGRGAPGFQTNVSRIAVPAHIIARIRAGEEVSAEEITAAQEEERIRQEREAKGLPPKKSNRKSATAAVVSDQPVNEWIPQGHNSPSSAVKNRSKRK
ncbi:unnamed protein product [Sympodiomycopsis kandeliae]